MHLAAFLALTAILVALPALIRRVLGWQMAARGYARWAIFAGPGLLYVLFLCDRALGFEWALCCGIGVNVALGLVTVQRGRRYFDIERLGKELSREDSAPALAALDATIAGFWASSNYPKQGALLTLHAARFALEANHAAHALKWLDAIPESEVSKDLRAPFIQYLASARMGSGDRVGAREAIARVARPAQPIAFDESLQAMVALLDVLDAEPSAGERARSALAGKPTMPARISWLAVHAHALAASGDNDGARNALGEIRLALGNPGLHRVVRHGGPASPLAASMLVPDGPYR